MDSVPGAGTAPAWWQDQPVAERKAFAEAPAASGDNAGAAARWRSLDEAGAHPEAPIFLARYTALLGQVAEARGIAARLLATGADRHALRVAAAKWYVAGLLPPWIAAVHGLGQLPDWGGEPQDRTFDRLLRASVLPELEEPFRGMALALLARLQDVPKRGIEQHPSLALAGAYGEPALAAHVATVLALPDEAFEEAAKKIAQLFGAGRLDAPTVRHFARAYGSRGRTLPLLVARLTQGRPGCLPLDLLADHPAAAWTAMDLRAATAAATRDATVPALAAAMARLRAAAPGEALAGQLEVAVAGVLGLAALPLARSLMEAAMALPAPAARNAAERLAESCFFELAADAVTPHEAGSEVDAYLQARWRWRLAPERRDLATWRRVAALHKSQRILRGLAAAEAELGDAAVAADLFAGTGSDSGAPTDHATEALTLERMGDFTAWAALVERVAQRHPQDAWVRSERLKLAVETGTPLPEASLPEDETAPTSASRNDRRTLARHFTATGANERVVTLRRGVVEETDDPSDHYHYVLALCQAGRFDEAGDRLRHLIPRFPGDFRLHLKQAQLSERAGDMEATLRSFLLSLIAEPMNRDGLAGVARAMTYLGEHAACDIWLDALPQQDITHGWVHAARAFNAVRRGRPEAALASLGVQVDLVQRLLAEVEAAGPGAVWHAGRFLPGRSARVAAQGAVFAADLAALRGTRPLLVGNSPRLLGGGLGPRIDGFGRILRLNDCQIRGHEADVGSLTHIWYSSANRAARPNLDNVEDIRVWLYQPNGQHLPEVAPFARGRLGMALREGQAIFLPPHIHWLTGSLIYPRPSTGFRVISLLELIVARPYAIAGFSFFEDEQMHYFGGSEGRLQVGEVHATTYERDFIREVLVLSPRFGELA